MAGRMENFGFLLSRTFASTKPRQRAWPYVPGTYFVADAAAPVAVCTLGSADLAPRVAANAPPGLCIAGKLETENIGIEKVVKNVIANPAIRFLLCVGTEPPKHLTGGTLMALFENGIDAARRIPGAPGMRPMLPNTTAAEVDAFRRQVEPVLMVGCTNVPEIHARIEQLAGRAPAAAAAPAPVVADPGRVDIERVIASGEDPLRIKLDKAGYFVVNIAGDRLLVEHYSYKEQLLRVIEGRDARSIYLTIVRNGWVSKLDHAAYLGRELTKAELSLRHGFEYRQDGA